MKNKQKVINAISITLFVIINIYMFFLFSRCYAQLQEEESQNIAKRSPRQSLNRPLFESNASYRSLSEVEKKKIKILIYKKYAKYRPRGTVILKRIEKYKKIIKSAAKITNLDPDLIIGLIAVESAGQNDAVSRVGAKGLMQIYDVPIKCKILTKKYLNISKINLANPWHNIYLGAITLDYYIYLKNNDVLLGLIAYNAGLGYGPAKGARNYIEAANKIKGGVKEFPPLVLSYALMSKSKKQYGRILPYNDERFSDDFFEKITINRQAIEKLYLPGLY